MKKITVFTPTYNRANLLPRLYKSLCSQTSQDFLWLVIDDGSSDGTEQLIRKWQSESKIDIQYHYKENGGMHTGHNAAYKIIETELNVCIDSDDYMPEETVEKIIQTWKYVDDNKNVAGIIGLDAEQNGKIIGTKIPLDLREGTLTDLYKKHGVTGDKKVVLQTEIVRQYPPYPEFKNEKLVPLGILYLVIGQDFNFIYSNEVYCIVEYQQDGSSSSIFKQYFQSPRGFAYARTIQKRFSNSLPEDLKNSMHIGISTLVTKDYSLLRSDPKKLYNYLMFPLAIVAHALLKLKIK